MLSAGGPTWPAARRIVCLGAHADDIEIGCGGTLLRLLAEAPREVTWVVLSADGERAGEARASAETFLAAAAARDVRVEAFPDAYFPDAWAEVKRALHTVAEEAAPDLVLTHRLDDRHQDHRVVAELTWNAFRGRTILEYEIPKWEGDLGSPNVLVALDEPTCRRKVEAIVSGFPSQRAKPWFSAETLWALLRLRGVEAAAAGSYAEGFHLRKAVV